MNHPHIVKAFDQDLAILGETIRNMGETAATQFTDAVYALLHHDLDRAQRVIDQDQILDALRRDISTSAATVITKRQPIASDLSEVLADLRIAEDLERIGDLAKNTAKRALAIAKRDFPRVIIENLQQLGFTATKQLREALSAFVQRDADLALLARDQDEYLDEQHTRVFRDIVSGTQGDQAQVTGFIHLLFCAKNIERVGDHAAHIAEAAYQLASGSAPPTERRRRDESSSITGETFIGVVPNLR